MVESVLVMGYEMNDKINKAYEDTQFLKRDECRPIRLQLEFLKPDVLMRQHCIRSTIVLFGSARLPCPETAEKELQEAQEALAQDEQSPDLQQRVKRAKRRVQQSHYYKVAREFAALVSQCCRSENGVYDYIMMTGGGGGIMEAGNRGAADVNAKSVGLNISLPYEQVPNLYLPDELQFEFHYFSIRKMHFLLRAKALCAFPGGYGTLDELFETLTLIQTGKIEPIPVLLFGKWFWERLINWDVMVEEELIDPEDLDIFQYCETPEEAWEIIQSFWQNRQKNQAKGQELK